jgi:hypothetical protein
MGHKTNPCVAAQPVVRGQDAHSAQQRLAAIVNGGGAAEWLGTGGWGQRQGRRQGDWGREGDRSAAHNHVHSIDGVVGGMIGAR